MNGLGELCVCQCVCVCVCICVCVSVCVCVHVYLYFSGRRAFSRTYNQTKEPEDVTVGFVVGKCISTVIGKQLQNTQCHVYQGCSKQF